MIAFLLCPSVPFVRFDHPVMLLCYADKHFVNVMKVYIERNNLQLEFIRYRNSSSNAARRYDDGCHVSRPRCLLQALSWLRMPMRLLQVRPQCRHM